VRFIRKSPGPAALRKFKDENKTTPQAFAYSALPTDVRSALYACMLAEQGKLCAYTMWPIGRDSGAAHRDFHIEHIRPRSRHPDRELDYDNLLLCVPGPGQEEPSFGARHKGNADVTDADFISPLSASCEDRLRFRTDGGVRPTKADDAAARRTIDLLALNHPAISQARIQAVRAQGLGPSARKPISAAEARRLVSDIMKANKRGEIAPFCVAVKQAAERFARQSEAHAARLKRAVHRS
jgi:uncharacterized protein (TIGR02646 family)